MAGALRGDSGAAAPAPKPVLNQPHGLVFWTGALCGFLVWLGTAEASILPEARVFPEAWQHAGHPGGAPVQFRTINVRDYNAAGDGQSNDRPALMDAIAALEGDPGVIYFPPGIYLLQAPVNVPSGVVLRGHSPAATTLRFDFVQNAIVFSGNQTGDWIAFSTSAAIHALEINLQSTINLAAGQYALLTQDDDPAWNITDSWGMGSAGQVIRISGVDGHRIILERPLRHDYPLERNPRLRLIQANLNAGIENMTLERLLAGDNSSRNNRHTVQFTHAAQGWMRGVHSKMAFGSHVSLDYSTRIEITGCYFDDAHEHDGGGSGYGVRFQFRTGESLLQDNIFRRLRHSILLQAGPNGNVIGYNYSREGHSDSHPGYAGDISLHGNYPYANLFEGNIIWHIWIDNSHNGANGPLNTFFRNRAEVAGFNMTDPSAHRQNVVGNELFRGGWLVQLLVGNGYRFRGSDHFTYANNTVASGLQPSGSGDLADISLYLGADPTLPPVVPDWWSIDDDLPVIGPPRTFSSSKNIPALVRWFGGSDLTVPAPVPELVLSSTSMEMVEGSVQTDSFHVTNNGQAALNWRIGKIHYSTAGPEWVTAVSPNAGILESGESAIITLHADRSLLGSDSASASVEIQSNGGEAVVTVIASALRHRINTHPGTGGNILPENPEVADGEDVLFYIQPEPFFDVANVWIDGVSTGPINQFLWQTVSADGVLAADSLVIRFGPSSPERLYSLQYSVNLDQANWQDIPGKEPRFGSGGQDQITVQLPDSQILFYRLKVSLPE